MREWFKYWWRAIGRARRDSISLSGWRIYSTVGVAVLRIALPSDILHLPRDIGPTVLWFLTAYLIIATGELLWRLLHTPAVLDRENRQELEKLEREVNELRDTRPKVCVSVEGPNVRVENQGAAATFEAKLIVVKEENWTQLRGALFDALWGKNRKSSATIPQHGYDYILLGDPPESLSPGKVRLKFFSQSNQTPEYVSTPGPASLHLRVSIYTNPAALDGPVVHDVELTAQGCRLIPR